MADLSGEADVEADSVEKFFDDSSRQLFNSRYSVYFKYTPQREAQNTSRSRALIHCIHNGIENYTFFYLKFWRLFLFSAEGCIPLSGRNYIFTFH